jgi:hypothetical protein
VFAGKKSAQIREILISESAWEEMSLFAPSLIFTIIMIICSEASFSKYEGFRLFTWRRDCSLRFQELTCAAEVYQELERQTQALEFDYYALCVRHPVPFTRPKISLQTTYPKLWMAQYQSANYFAIDPVLKPENFIQGHLLDRCIIRRGAGIMAQRPGSRFTLGNNAVPDAAKSCAWFPVSVSYACTGRAISP